MYFNIEHNFMTFLELDTNVLAKTQISIISGLSQTLFVKLTKIFLAARSLWMILF